MTDTFPGMTMRVIRIQPKSRAGALALGAGVVIVGAVLVVVGLSLLLALTAGAVVLGTGYALYRKLAGHRPRIAPRQSGVADLGLDPRLEVRPPSDAKGALPSPRPKSGSNSDE